MMELGYPHLILSCSYDGKDGLYNDYSRYYSPASKIAHDSAGHMITLIFMEPGKYVRCEVQGYGLAVRDLSLILQDGRDRLTTR